MANTLREQVASLRQTLFDEEILDSQFLQLEQLEGDDSPHFVEEVMTLYFRDSVRFIQTIEEILEKTPIDFEKLDRTLHQLKGSSASIGANKVKTQVIQMREQAQNQNLEGCKTALLQIKEAHSVLKDKLTTYFQMKQQVGPAEAAEPPK